MLPSCRQVCSPLKARGLCRRSSIGLVEVSEGLAQLSNSVSHCSTTCNGSLSPSRFRRAMARRNCLSIPIGSVDHRHGRSTLYDEDLGELDDPPEDTREAMRSSTKAFPNRWQRSLRSKDVEKSRRAGGGHRGSVRIGPEKCAATRLKRVGAVAVRQTFHRFFARVCDYNSAKHNPAVERTAIELWSWSSDSTGDGVRASDSSPRSKCHTCSSEYQKDCFFQFAARFGQLPVSSPPYRQSPGRYTNVFPRDKPIAWPRSVRRVRLRLGRDHFFQCANSMSEIDPRQQAIGVAVYLPRAVCGELYKNRSRCRRCGD